MKLDGEQPQEEEIKETQEHTIITAVRQYLKAWADVDSELKAIDLQKLDLEKQIQSFKTDNCQSLSQPLRVAQQSFLQSLS